jgi:dUTP pyrophosphatase
VTTPIEGTAAPTFVVEPLYSDAQLPERATAGSAGYDLRAYVRDRSIQCSDGLRTWVVLPEERNDPSRFTIPVNACALIPLGFRARLPMGIEGQIRPRSGMSFKKGLQIPNAPGTIDSDFPDEWMVLVRNPQPHLVVVEHGERIAQLVIARYEVLPVEHGSVRVTTTRTGGFGSTGV